MSFFLDIFLSVSYGITYVLSPVGSITKYKKREPAILNEKNVYIAIAVMPMKPCVQYLLKKKVFLNLHKTNHVTSDNTAFYNKSLVSL